jgi:hypothetical protein
MARVLTTPITLQAIIINGKEVAIWYSTAFDITNPVLMNKDEWGVGIPYKLQPATIT